MVVAFLVVYGVFVIYQFLSVGETATIRSEVVGHEDDPHYVRGDCDNWE